MSDIMKPESQPPYQPLAAGVSAPPLNGKGTPFLTSLELLFRWRRFIIILLLIAAALAAGVSFLLPKWYRASASIMQPKQQDLFGGGLSSVASTLAKGIPGASRLGFGQKSQSYNLFALLNSRTAMEQVVRKFDLFGVYNISDTVMEKAVKELSLNCAFEEQTDDYISVQVKDKDPQRAAAMANYFIEVLNEMSIKLGTQEARLNREFIGQRLEQARRDLHAAEDTLRAYQERSKMIITPDESATLAGIASLYGERARKEVELAVLRHGAADDNPLVEQLKVEIGELDKKLNTIPQIGVESLRRYRDVLIQEKIQEFLVPMYEQARVDEVKDIPVVLVLDKAIPPEKKSAPQRTVIVLVTFVLAALVLVAAAYLVYRYTLPPVSDVRRTVLWGLSWERTITLLNHLAPGSLSPAPAPCCAAPVCRQALHRARLAI